MSDPIGLAWLNMHPVVAGITCAYCDTFVPEGEWHNCAYLKERNAIPALEPEPIIDMSPRVSSLEARVSYLEQEIARAFREIDRLSVRK